MKIALFCAMALVWCNTASAFIGTCRLKVNGQVYLSGPCNIDMEKDGSFSIGTGNEQTASAYFAYVLVTSPGVADGYWNGTEQASKAHDSLGTLVRNGACWQNGSTEVCAWK